MMRRSALFACLLASGCAVTDGALSPAEEAGKPLGTVTGTVLQKPFVVKGAVAHAVNTAQGQFAGPSLLDNDATCSEYAGIALAGSRELVFRLGERAPAGTYVPPSGSGEFEVGDPDQAPRGLRVAHVRLVAWDVSCTREEPAAARAVSGKVTLSQAPGTGRYAGTFSLKLANDESVTGDFDVPVCGQSPGEKRQCMATLPDR